MKRIILLFSIVMSTIIFLHAFDAEAATKKNAKDYRLNTSMFKSFTYQAKGSGVRLCPKNSATLTYRKSQVMDVKGWVCPEDGLVYTYKGGNKRLLMIAAGTDAAIIDVNFPLKEGSFQDSYYDVMTEKNVYYKTKVTFKKSLKTKAGVIKDVIVLDATSNITATNKWFYKYYIAKNRGLIKTVDYKGNTTFEVTKFVKK